ncbi:MAG: hypothetical protein HQ539_02575 [Parcubacteria group bacterium]|nr:hypothetical protein [Parcubacteria group bacterium]
MGLVIWHYSGALKGLLKVWRNFLVFTLHYFPVKELLKTLFAHWRRSADSYGKGLDIGRWSRAFLGNMISRGVGAVARIFIIIIGLVAEVLVFFFGLAIILIWICLPVFVVIGLFSGIGLLFGL